MQARKLKPLIEFKVFRIFGMDSLPRTSGVYRLTNMKTAESYIGSSGDMLQRAHGHCALLNCGKHDSLALQRSFFEHGHEAFRFEVLELVGESRYIREAKWIQLLEPEFNGCQGVMGPERDFCMLPKIRKEQPKRLSFAERQLRRHAMAQAARTSSVNEVAERFGVTTVTVRNACIEHGVWDRRLRATAC